MRNSFVNVAVIGVVSVSSAWILSAGNNNDGSAEIMPNGKGHLPKDKDINANGSAKKKPPLPVINNISYHGGPVMLGTTNVYYIWYGDWSGNSATTILPSFASSIGGSPYFNINTTYTNGSGGGVSNSVAYKGAISDNYSQGTQLSDTAIQAIVAGSLTQLPAESNAVYFVLTSKDITATSGFCTQYCGWHTHATIGGKDIKYSFVGNPDRCPSACAYQTTSPNGNAGADGMASVIAHELSEAVTDPDLNAWYDATGLENADKCAWTFGTPSKAANGSAYNVVLGGSQYLIQQNWKAGSSQGCAIKYP